MLTLEKTIEKIRHDKTPFWKLWCICGNLTPNVIAECKEDNIDKSIEQLKFNFNIFPESHYYIETKSLLKEAYQLKWPITNVKNPNYINHNSYPLYNQILDENKNNGWINPSLSPLDTEGNYFHVIIDNFSEILRSLDVGIISLTKKDDKIVIFCNRRLY